LQSQRAASAKIQNRAGTAHTGLSRASTCSVLHACAAGRPRITGRLDRQFQAAVTQYESGRLAEAATALEALLGDIPESFEVHELLGLVYAAQSQYSNASPHLEKQCD